MKTDEDEVYLSAYLDGELDAHQRTTVESAMLSNPALAERYRQLAAVRDLIANLPRPTLQEDLSTTIAAHASSRATKPLPQRFGARPLARFATAAAALILLSVGLASFSNRRPEPPPHKLALQPRTATNPSKALAPAETRPDADELAKPMPIAATEPAKPEPTPTPHRPIVAQHNEADLRADQEQTRIRELLDSPHLKHVFMVVDEIGSDAPDQVEGIVRRMPRISPDFGKITVSQGIVIDPQHPNKATVFALVMDQNEIKQFRKRLDAEFPKRVTEAAAEPAVVTQLSEIGQVAILSGTRATELAATPAQATQKPAIRRPREPALLYQNSPEFGNLPVEVVDRLPPPSADAATTAKASADRDRSSTAVVSSTEGDQTPKAAIVANAEPSQESGQRSPSVVLVWVTTVDPTRKGRY